VEIGSGREERRSRGEEVVEESLPLSVATNVAHVVSTIHVPALTMQPCSSPYSSMTIRYPFPTNGGLDSEEEEDEPSVTGTIVKSKLYTAVLPIEAKTVTSEIVFSPIFSLCVPSNQATPLPLGVPRIAFPSFELIENVVPGQPDRLCFVSVSAVLMILLVSGLVIR